MNISDAIALILGILVFAALVTAVQIWRGKI